jgi:hypothetical protein
VLLFNSQKVSNTTALIASVFHHCSLTNLSVGEEMAQVRWDVGAECC